MTRAEPADGRQSRSAATRAALMRAAERLIAERGIARVTLRDIVDAAGQKNQSALQYHFGDLDGLIAALHAERNAEIRAKRAAMIEDLMDDPAAPTLRDVCKVMVGPAFALARARPDFRRYVKAFGHEITLAPESAVELAGRKGGTTAVQTGALLRRALPHLDEAALQRRLDGALRFVSASMVQHAGQRNAFRGPGGELFFSSLIDALEGLLGAPESAETRAIARSTRSH